MKALLPFFLSAALAAGEPAGQKNPTDPTDPTDQKKTTETTETGEPAPAEDHDKEMSAAMAKARETFPAAAAEAAKASLSLLPGIDSFLAKALFTGGGENPASEHLWIKHLSYDPASKTIAATLASSSPALPALRKGQQVTLPLARLSDWLLVRQGTAEGAFTVRLLRSRMTPAEREEHDARYPFDFPDPEEEPADPANTF